MSQLNLSAIRRSGAVSGDEADSLQGNVCPRFSAYHRRAASAHAGKLLTPSSISYSLSYYQLSCWAHCLYQSALCVCAEVTLSHGRKIGFIDSTYLILWYLNPPHS